MKNLTTQLMIAAAAFVAAAGVASAQSMEANIPFAFRAGGKVFAPGTYRVEMLSKSTGVPVFAISSREPGAQVLSIALPDGYAKRAWTSAGNAILSFQCGVSRCALTQVWMGNSESLVYRLPSISLGRDEPQHVTEIAMHPVKAD